MGGMSIEFPLTKQLHSFLVRHATSIAFLVCFVSPTSILALH